MQRRTFLAASAATTSLLAGCTGGYGGGGESTGTETGTASPADGRGEPDATIRMVDTSFDPLEASVDVGATVQWVNEDAFGHEVASAQFHDAAASWEFATDTLGSGDTATYTFETEGVYEYYCPIHGKGTMCGAVLVGDVSIGGSLPCGGGGGGYGGEY